MAPWIETASGRKYHFLSPKLEDICIEDIGFALSNKCRFSGHTQFYSVAEHCVAVARRLPRRLQLAGLLHDAAEAYLGDIPSPLKEHLPDYKNLEGINEAVIEKKFNILLSSNERREIKQADLQALYNEAYFLLPSQGKEFSMFQHKEWKLDRIYPECLPPEDAFRVFMSTYHSLVEPVQMELF